MARAHQCDYCGNLMPYGSSRVSFKKFIVTKNIFATRSFDEMDFCSYMCLTDWAMNLHEYQNEEARGSSNSILDLR